MQHSNGYFIVMNMTLEQLPGREYPICFYQIPASGKQSPKGVILFNPAMDTRAKYYEPLALAFSGQGYHVYIHELRGIGESPIRATRDVDFGYLDLLEDLDVLVDHVQKSHQGLPTTIAGHSMGGQLSLLYAAKFSSKITNVLLIACGTPHHSGYSGKQKLLLSIVPYIFTTSALVYGYFPGKKLGFGGIQGKTLINDWGVLAKSNRFSVQGDSFDYEKALRKIDFPVSVYCFETDAFAPEKSVKEIIKKLNPERVSFRCFSKGELDFYADHMNWVKRSDWLIEQIL